MRILVTGHAGYIGTVMTPMLEAEGFEVVGLDSDLYQRCTFGSSLPKVASIQKDIRDVSVDDLRGFDALIHLAALSNDPLGNLDPSLTYDINYHASVHLARAAKQAGVERFLYSSSCSLYGAAAGDDLLNEDAEFNPVTPYGESKVLSEQAIVPLANDTFSPTYFRNATAYGLSPRHRFDLVVNNLVAWAVATGRIFMKSDGSPWRPLVHIEDISRAYVAALRAPRERIHNQAFNVGINGENYRIREIAAIVKEEVPGCEVEFATDASPDKRNYRVDFSKIARVLPEYQPVWNVRAAVRQLRDAYEETGIAVDEFEGPKYRRVDHIKMLVAAGELDASLRRVPEAVL